MDAEESALRVRAAWRGDVLAAWQILPGKTNNGRQEMTIRRGGPDGRELTILYQLMPDGAIVRVTIGPQGNRLKEEILAREATRLEFESTGAGWRMSWLIEDFDGLQRHRWREDALATPIIFDG